MSAETSVLLASFFGSILGIPGGMMLARAIDELRDRFRRRKFDLLEFLIASPDSVKIESSQVASCWVYLIDSTAPAIQAGGGSSFVVYTVGGPRRDPVGFSARDDAMLYFGRVVASVRTTYGID